MAASVNSDRRIRRTSGGVWRWAVRRFGAVVVTMAALISVNWISPQLGGAPSPAPASILTVEASMPPKSAELALKPLEKPGWVDAVQTPASPRPHRRHRALEAPHGAQIDGFEVLGADELDAISQAH